MVLSPAPANLTMHRLPPSSVVLQMFKVRCGMAWPCGAMTLLSLSLACGVDLAAGPAATQNVTKSADHNMP